MCHASFEQLSPALAGKISRSTLPTAALSSLKSSRASACTFFVSAHVLSIFFEVPSMGSKRLQSEFLCHLSKAYRLIS